MGTWVVAYSRSEGPTEYVIYDQEKKEIKPLFVSKPELLYYKFAPMEDIRVKARDGLELVGYLTRADKEKKTPLILLVHGGPWARDFWGFNTQAQWFANRGYACLAGLTYTPDLYKCGVDIVGPSNIKTLLDSIPSYWGPLRNDMLKKIGDVDSDEEFNKKISPLY